MTSALDVELGARLGGFELDVRFTVPARGVTALFGRSGSGKTSVINSLAGILRPSRGFIRMGELAWFDSERGVDVPIPERAVGYVFQDARLFPHLGVSANLEYGLKRARRRGRPIQIGVEEVVGLLGLEGLLGRRPQRLSGGERQRVALGRALLSQPRVLLMDEPLAALDGPRKAEIMPYIERLRDELGLPIVYVSHSVEEITRLADHVVILAEGKSVASGPLLAIMGDPRYARLIGRYEAGTVLECTVVAHDPGFELTELAFPGGRLSVPKVGLAIGSGIRVRLRAREIALATRAPEDLSISNQLAGHVEAIIAREGPYVEVVVRLGASTVRSLITREARARLELVEGKPVWALIKSVALDRRSVAV
jgi:molybdate transport system ATP-binding protein